MAKIMLFRTYQDLQNEHLNFRKLYILSLDFLQVATMVLSNGRYISKLANLRHKYWTKHIGFSICRCSTFYGFWVLGVCICWSVPSFPQFCLQQFLVAPCKIIIEPKENSNTKKLGVWSCLKLLISHQQKKCTNIFDYQIEVDFQMSSIKEANVFKVT